MEMKSTVRNEEESRERLRKLSDDVILEAEIFCLRP
jgi:hypothetical protein